MPQQPASPWDWLGQPAFQQQGGLPPEIMQQAGVPRTSRLAAIGQLLMGLGQGANQRAAQGGGLLSQLAGGAAGGANALAGAQDQERQQTMQSLLQQASIAKAMRPDGGETSEFERLLGRAPPNQREKLLQGRLGTLASESQQETYREPTPEELAANPGLSQISSTGKKVFQPSEMVVSPVEQKRLQISEMLAQGTITQAQATRELAQSQAAAAQAQRDIANNQAAVSFSAGEADRAMARENRERDDVANLRKEFDSKPEVQNYKVISPTFKSALEANKSRGPGADLEFVYAVGKILDPGSAVREGEQAAIANSQSPANILSGFLDWVQGGNKLTEDQRNQLLQIMDRRARSAHELYKGAADTFSSYAKENYGVDPSRVVRDIGAPPELPKFGAAAAPAAPAPIVQPPGTGVSVGPGMPPLPPGFVMGQ